MSESDDRDHRTPMEGVRIIGAEETGSTRPVPGPDAPEGDAAEGDDAAGVSAAPAGEAGARRARTYPDAGPSWSASGAPAAPAEHPDADPRDTEAPDIDGDEPGDEASGPAPVTALPHWTEPPTLGEPIVDPGAEGDDDLEAWASLTGSQPVFRSEGADWEAADFGAMEDDDAGTGLGAEPEIDDDASFASAVAARRRGGSRRPATPRTEAPAAPARPARARPEPAAGPPPEDAPGGRDVPTALGTAAVIVVVALLCFNAGVVWTAFFVAAIAALAALELSSSLLRRGLRPAVPLAIVGAAALPIAAQEYGAIAFPVVLVVVLAATMVWFLWEVTPGRPVIGVATTLLVVAYVGGLAGFAGLILQFDPDGIGLVLGLALCVIAYDVVGFFVGSQFGQTPVAPRISPHKTLEGTAAGMFGAVLVGWVVVGGLVGPGIHPWSPGRGIVLGLLLAVGAFLGDICESMLKRDLGIKDFGTLLPGHGGVLDRFDGLMFALPITYFLALHYAPF